MADSFEEQLNEWVQQIASMTVGLTLEEKSEITEAGARVFRSKLESVTRQKHYSHHNDKVYGHMADHITLMNKDVNNDMNGNSTVGWENKYHALNALHLNDGTRKIKADHFVTNLYNDKLTQNAVLSVEEAKYKEIIQRKG